MVEWRLLYSKVDVYYHTVVWVKDRLVDYDTSWVDRFDKTVDRIVEVVGLGRNRHLFLYHEVWSHLCLLEAERIDGFGGLFHA